MKTPLYMEIRKWPEPEYLSIKIIQTSQFGEQLTDLWWDRMDQRQPSKELKPYTR